MSDAPKVSVVEFVVANGLYRSGERAGFPPELAREYVRRGIGRLVAEHVDAVDSRTREHDAMRRAAELRQLAQNAESEAAYHRAAADRGQAQTRSVRR